MEKYLTDLEIAKVEQFCNDKEMSEAVKKVILQAIYSQGVITHGQEHDPLKNRALVLVADNVNNEELGGKLRALWEGVNALETGFNNLSKIKSKKEVLQEEDNEAI